jgi:hypothetical protein
VNFERAALRGQIAVAKKELTDKDLEANGIRTLLRQALPLYQSVITLELDKIENHCARLVAVVNEMRELQGKLDLMENELNG